MNELEKYVDGLFRRRRFTPEIQDLKEEILSNMLAKRDDLIAQGLSAEEATEMARESVSDIDCLIDGNQLTDVGKYRSACMQTLLLNCIIFWILSLPLLFTGYAALSYLGLALVLFSGCAYILMRGGRAPSAAFLSVTACERRTKIAWVIWAVFFLVMTGTMAALTFGSNFWFGRPIRIDGPYQMANLAVRFYLPLLTILVPITFGSFSKILLKCRKEYGNE